MVDLTNGKINNTLTPNDVFGSKSKFHMQALNLYPSMRCWLGSNAENHLNIYRQCANQE